jgi:hypothetical protein
VSLANASLKQTPFLKGLENLPVKRPVREGALCKLIEIP